MWLFKPNPKAATRKQIKYLKSLGVPIPCNLTKIQASRLIDRTTLTTKASFRHWWRLRKHGIKLPKDCTIAHAHQLEELASEYQQKLTDLLHFINAEIEDERKGY